MEEKHNNSTPQRPSGARVLDAPLVAIDIPKYIDQLKTEEAFQKNGKNAITVFKSGHTTITLIVLTTGEIIKPGSEENEAIMSLQVLNGALDFESQGEKLELHAGKIVALHQALSFTATALSESICLLTMIK